MPEPILELKAITRDFGNGVIVNVLKGIDLTIESGEFTAMIGPSGSGKSTLLNIMGLLDQPTSGELLIQGNPTVELEDSDITKLRGQTLGFIFQAHHLLTAFSALENVMMPAGVRRGSFSKSIRSRAEDLLDNVGLADHMHKNVRNLSGGQQQRVAVARALANKPELVLADEPTGNLDTKNADIVFELLQRINDETGTAFMIVTHEERLANRCERIIRMLDGRISEHSPSTE